MFYVAITGVMGAGKSTVCSVLKAFGVEVYDSDSRAKMLINTKLNQQVINLFGAKAYLPDQTLDRPYIAEQIFSDTNLRHRLEAIVHPAVTTDFIDWAARGRRSPYVVIESALIVGYPLQNIIDCLVVVTCDQDQLIRRVTQRDAITAQQVRRRLANQLSQTQMENAAKLTIKTSSDELLVPKVVELHEKLLTLSLENRNNN